MSFVGKDGGELAKISDIVFHIKVTVQQWCNRHTYSGMEICELLEN